MTVLSRKAEASFNFFEFCQGCYSELVMLLPSSIISKINDFPYESPLYFTKQSMKTIKGNRDKGLLQI